jgi:hypothetical protein
MVTIYKNKGVKSAPRAIGIIIALSLYEQANLLPYVLADTRLNHLTPSFLYAVRKKP